MSLPARKFVKSKRTGSQSRRAVLNCIADWMIGDSTVECWPTVENIVFDTEMNPQTVSKVTKELVELGFITKRRKFNTEKRRWETHYTLVGFSPAEWVNAPWPTACSCQEPTGNTAHGKSHVQEPVPTEARELEPTGNQGLNPTGNRGLNPPENRSRTGIEQEYKQEQTCTFLCPSVGDEPPFPEADLWPDLPAPDSENPAPPEVPTPKRKRTPSGGATEATDGGPAPVKKSVRAKPKTLCPFDLEDVCPAEWTDAFAAAFPSLSLEAEFRRFVGYHVAKGTAFVNWKAAFRNWLSNAVSFQARDTARFGCHPAPTRNRPLQKEDMVYTDNF